MLFCSQVMLWATYVLLCVLVWPSVWACLIVWSAGLLYKGANQIGCREAEKLCRTLCSMVCTIPSGLAYCDGVSDVCLVIKYIMLREGACYTSNVVLWHEACCSSSSYSLDSSNRREVRLHQRVSCRIDVPHLQVACIAHVIGCSC
jgi:hypothetical protein